jgi:DNA polymerase III sliding clamp (beta) subunit (PCNA family)
MDFTIGTEELQNIVRLFGVPIRANALDSTGRILIEATDRGVEFVANNGSIAMIYFSYDTQVSAPGITSITYSKIKSFVSSFKPWNESSGAKSFRFVKEEKTTTIHVENVFENGKVSKGNLKLTNYNPVLVNKPSPFGTASFSLNSTVFRLATNKVLYAVNPATDESYGALQGLHISFDEDSIFFVGSDGRVLSEYKVPNTGDFKDGSITMTYDFVMGLRRLINDDVQLLWEVKGNRVAIKFENVTFIGRLIVGHEYPDYKHMLEQFSDKVNFTKEVFLGFLQPFVDVLNPDDNNRLSFEIKDKVVRVSNDQADLEVEQEIPGSLNFSIDVNGKLMMQSIDAIKDDYIMMKFTAPDKPLIFDASTTEDQKSLLTPLTKR